MSTLVYRIDVHARLLILRKNSPLHGLILVCTFIDFEKKFPPARLFHPAHLLILVCSKLVVVIQQQNLDFMGNFCGKTSIFHKFKPLDSKESAVFFKICLFFLIQLYKYTLFQSKRASFKVAVLFYLGLSLIFQKISPCTFINFPENFLPARLF